MQQWHYFRQNYYYLLEASTHNNSDAIGAAAKAVISLTSYAGDTPTTSLAIAALKIFP